MIYNCTSDSHRNSSKKTICIFFLKKNNNYYFVIDRMVIHSGELQLSTNHLQCWVDPDCPDFVRLLFYLYYIIFYLFEMKYIHIFQMIYIIMQILLPPNYPPRKPFLFCLVNHVKQKA